MGTPLRVLIVEDSEDDMALMVYELRRHGYDLTYERVETEETMRAALASHQWDVILSDFSMPRFNAHAALRVVQDMGVETPVIIVSGTVGEEAAVAAMKAGAHDFFSKHKLVRLVPAIERELRESEDRRKRLWVEEQLYHSEERFAKAFRAGPLGILINTADGVFVDANDRFLQLSGYSRDEVIGQTYADLRLWVDPEIHVQLAQATREGQIIQDHELQFRTKAGEVRDALYSFTTIELGGEVCLLSMVHDITERKRIEEDRKRMTEERRRLLEQKQEAMQQFINTLDRITDGFVMLNHQWQFAYVNPRASEILGYRVEELIGSNAWTKFPEAVDGRFYDAFQVAVNEQRTVEIEAFFEPWKRWFVNRIYPSAEGVNVFFQDITERKKQEQHTLEAERLRVEITKERELLQLKENFISIVSHEFRTPLTAIMSSAELIQRYYDHLPRERHFHHLGEILSQSNFMVNLLDDVLTVNKSRAGWMEFKPVSMDLAAFCNSVVERLRAQDKEKHQFIVHIDGDLSQVVMDARLLRHIVVNLLTNAVKYSAEGGEIKLDILRQGEDVVLRVSDQGIGIPIEAMSRLYEPFQRAGNVGTISGTGLGLTIVKDSVERHGGAIMCQSQVGVGTIFTVRLPVISQA